MAGAERWACRAAPGRTPVGLLSPFYEGATMGAIGFGTASRFLIVADVAWHPLPPWIFKYEVVLATWIVVSVAIGLLLVGWVRIPYLPSRSNVGWGRFILAVGFFGLAAFIAVDILSPASSREKAWWSIRAHLPPKAKRNTDAPGPYIVNGDLEYALDFQQALDFAVKQNLPVFLDFTGVNCVNCRKMEKGPMTRPEIQKRLISFVRIQLFTDRVPVVEDKSEAERLGAQNRNIQREWFGDVSLPAYAVIPPDSQILGDPKKILARFEGYDQTGGTDFAHFLDEGLAKWQALKEGAAAPHLVGRR